MLFHFPRKKTEVTYDKLPWRMGIRVCSVKCQSSSFQFWSVWWLIPLQRSHAQSPAVHCWTTSVLELCCQWLKNPQCHQNTSPLLLCINFKLYLLSETKPPQHPEVCAQGSPVPDPCLPLAETSFQSLFSEYSHTCYCKLHPGVNLQHIVYNTFHSSCSHIHFCLQNSVSLMAKQPGIHSSSNRGDSPCIRADRLISALKGPCVHMLCCPFYMSTQSHVKAILQYLCW